MRSVPDRIDPIIHCVFALALALVVAYPAFPSGTVQQIEQDPCQKGEDLLEGTAFGPRTPLKQCIRFGNTKEALNLISKDGKNAASDWIVLLYTALTGNSEVMKALLAHGADPNQTIEIFGNNVLSTAAHQGHVELVRVLLDAGADPNRQSDGEFAGGPALVYAASAGNFETVKLLIARGAGVNLREAYHGYSPLWEAICRSGSYKVARFLLKQGANPNVRDAGSFSGEPNDGRTPLACAVKSNDLPMIKLLIQYGADVNAKFLQINVPISLARQQGNSGVVEVLRKAGARE